MRGTTNRKSRRRNADVHYYMHDGSTTFRFKLAGNLSDAGARELQQAWRTASSIIDGKELIVDISQLTGIGDAGRTLLSTWQLQGGIVVADRAAACALLDSIPGISFGDGGNAGRTHRWPIAPRGVFRLLGVLALLTSSHALGGDLRAAQPTSAPSAAFARYIVSTQEPSPFTGSGPVIIQVDASLPSLYKESRLLALRQMGESKRSEYGLLQVEGDATVIQEVIAPYLAVQDAIEALPLPAVAVTPANYRFHYMGQVGSGEASSYVFRITPKKKREGMIEGELWIDSITGAGVLQKGRFVKTHSGFSAPIQVVRDTKLMNGVPCVRVTHAAVETRHAGRGELTITEYRLIPGQEEPESPGTAPGPTNPALRGSLIQ